MRRTLYRTFDSELFLFSAASREGLLDAIGRVEKFLEDPSHCRPADLAFTLGKGYRRKWPCLAVVASSWQELRSKLQYATARLREKGCRQIREKKGIYYFAHRLGAEGKLAFLFPGEGSQYTNMMRDLCLYFPEARSAFDIADGACRGEPDGFVPSALIFPTGNSEGQSREGLWDIHFAVLAVLGANEAMRRIFERLGIRPDVVAGHSSGEVAALDMAGALGERDDERMVHKLRDIYQMIKRLDEATNIPTSVLLTVGGIDRDRIDEAMARFDGYLQLAMENCSLQYILCVPEEKTQKIAQHFVAQGAICEPLPFRRPYHTSWFSPALSTVKSILQKMEIRPPQIEVYSCMTASPFPHDPDEVRDIFLRQWAAPVRFQETVEAMYADGVRIFADVGPRGPLAAFADNILRDRPHLAVACNRADRSGIHQLHHALGLLAAHGVAMNLDYLHLRRGSRLLDLDAGTERRDGNVHKQFHFPPAVPRIRAGDFVLRHDTTLRKSGQTASTVPVAATDNGVTSGAVMMAYLDAMQEFLASQGELLQQMALPVPVSAVVPQPKPLSARRGSAAGPLVGQLVEIVPARSLVSIRRFDVNEDLFLEDHTFGTAISTRDPTLRGLPVLPLVMSLETAAETALQLFPEKVVTKIKDIRGNRWVTFEEEIVTLRVVARCISTADPVEVRVELREEGPDDKLATYRPAAAEATVVLEDRYPTPPLGPAIVPTVPGERVWERGDIYPQRTFHGPRFQGIASVDRFSGNWLEGTLIIPSRACLFRREPKPVFAVDPIFVDSMGQLLGLIATRELFTGEALLPFSVEEIRFYGSPLPVGTVLKARMVWDSNEQQHWGNIQAVDANGRLCVDILGWRDRTFQITPGLHRALLVPTEQFLTDKLTPSSEVLDPHDGGHCICAVSGFPLEVFNGSYGIWYKSAAFAVLNPVERQEWKKLTGTIRSRSEWLLGRAAAKDSVRHLLRRKFGTSLGAADITIATDGKGRPIVAGGWNGSLSQHPRISIAHTQGLAVAVAIDAERKRTPGIDVELLREPEPSFLEGAFSASDLRLLPPGEAAFAEWALRLWCAKEALSKALGTGLRFGPKHLIVESVDLNNGQVSLGLKGEWLKQFPALEGTTLRARTYRMEGHVLGLCSIPDEKGS